MLRTSCMQKLEASGSQSTPRPRYSRLEVRQRSTGSPQCLANFATLGSPSLSDLLCAPSARLARAPLQKKHAPSCSSRARTGLWLGLRRPPLVDICATGSGWEGARERLCNGSPLNWEKGCRKQCGKKRGKTTENSKSRHSRACLPHFLPNFFPHPFSHPSEAPARAAHARLQKSVRSSPASEGALSTAEVSDLGHPSEGATIAGQIGRHLLQLAGLGPST